MGKDANTKGTSTKSKKTVKQESDLASSTASGSSSGGFSVFSLLLGFVIGALLSGVVLLNSPALLPSPTAAASTPEAECSAEASKKQPKTDQVLPKSRQDQYDVFMRWFLENGGFLNRAIELRIQENDPDNWGFFALADLKEGDVILSIPQHLYLTASSALSGLVENPASLAAISTRQDITPRKIVEAVGFTNRFNQLKVVEDIWNAEPADMQLAIMALYMMAHWNDASHFFYPYFTTLPRGCQSAVCWSKERIRDTFSEQYAQALADEKALFYLVAEQLGVDKEDLLQKISLIKSRYWDDPAMEDMATLVPMADMINHPNEADETGLIFLSAEMEGAFLRLEGKGAAAGKEVRASYGEKSNAVLLSEYGFALEKNVFDTCEQLLEILNPKYIAQHIVLPDGVGPCV